MTLKPNPWPVVILLWAAVAIAVIHLYGCAPDTDFRPVPPGDADYGDASGTRVTEYNPCDNFVTASCYDGPLWKTVNQPCRAGLLQCHYEHGRMWTTCEGAVYPREEKCSDVDENCNGIVNDGVALSPYDIVIAVDTSGSMCAYMSAVMCAVRQYVEALNAEDYRFALVDFTGIAPDRVTVVLPFTTPADAYSALLQLECNGSGSEASYDALAALYDPQDPLNLQWRPGTNRAVLMFLDERGQSYTTPPVTWGDLQTGYQIRTNIWGQNTADYKAIALSTGGSYFTLSNNCERLAEQALETVGDLCE